MNGIIRDTVVPKPGAGEVVMTKAWVERGLSPPVLEFFLSILNTYGLQPHNICPNSYLLLSNFATLCEGHLGIRPDVKLWQFFFRVKKETKDKAMLNCGSMTFMLRPGRMYPPHDSHESVRYWNAGWFYEKNVSVPEIHDGLPKFNNEPPEELASWSLTLSWFTRRIQPLRYNARLICAYTGADDQLRATRHDLPADSLKRRFKTLVKIGRGQPIPELIKDIYTNNQCPPLDTLAEENFRTILVSPLAATRRRRFRMTKRRKRSRHPARQPPDLRSVPAPKLPAQAGAGRGLRQEAQDHQAPSARLKESGAGTFEDACHSRQTLAPHHPRRPNSDYRCHSDHQPRAHHKIYEKVSGCWSYNSSSAKRFPHCSTAISSSGGTISPSCRKHSTGSNSGICYQVFHKLTEAEKWELEQDLLNAMLNNAWGKPDAATSEIQDFKKDVGQFFDKLICKQKVLPSASSSLATTSSELENLRSSYQELETKLMEAEQKKEQAEKQLAEKNSELIREKGEFLLKRNADSETIKRQQKELNGLRKYMETAEHHWDLLAENILDVGALLDAVSGYDTRIARRIRHEEFYDKVVLPADEPLEAELQKERDAEARPAESGTQFTWTSSKDAPQEEPKSSAATSEEEEESEEDVSSPAEDAKEKDPEGNASPSKAE
ncbi:hypothetical protein QYE76_053377 [Lolium multiflorum]|uniref:Transposase (putative) gypsy type domain-containing protein n=1 Tax=Lolium multiflorum TaxID=4521 RepID=A0AAD8SVL2_LOLMU|nr:hypothetical protein QYE76_053377 [Lolium multiflorum]